jgi:hypothetical protein
MTGRDFEVGYIGFYLGMMFSFGTMSLVVLLEAVT